MDGFTLTPSKYLAPPELEHLETTLAHFKATDPRNVTLLWFMLRLGTRPQETLNVTWSDLNHHSRTVFIRTMKGGPQRNLPMAKWLFDRLLALGPGNPGDRIFKIKRGQFNRIWHLYRPVKKSLHCLRHTFAVELYRHTKDVSLVQTALGHKHLSTTSIYLQIAQSEAALRKGMVR